jgi:putative oxidoreductase
MKFKNMNKVHPYIILFMRIVLGLVFIAASYDKLLNPQQFARDISNYHFIPFGLENFVAIILPWIELFIGTSLILGIMIDGSVLTTGVLLIMFNFLVFQAMIRGFNIECGCGLKEGEMVGVQKLIENFTLLIFSYTIFINKKRIFEFYPKTTLS